MWVFLNFLVVIVAQDKDVFYDDLQEEDNSLKGPGPDEIKNGQWLGVTVKSSNPSNGGKVLVCAHRYIKSPQLNDTHHGLGLCHLLNASLGWEEALEPCEGKPMQKYVIFSVMILKIVCNWS